MVVIVREGIRNYGDKGPVCGAKKKRELLICKSYF
jgi:hypothetical protein